MLLQEFEKVLIVNVTGTTVIEPLLHQIEVIHVHDVGVESEFTQVITSDNMFTF